MRGLSRLVLGCVLFFMLSLYTIAVALPPPPVGGNPPVFTCEHYSNTLSTRDVPELGLIHYDHTIKVDATYSGNPTGSTAYLANTTNDLTLYLQNWEEDYDDLSTASNTAASGSLSSTTVFTVDDSTNPWSDPWETNYASIDFFANMQTSSTQCGMATSRWGELVPSFSTNGPDSSIEFADITYDSTLNNVYTLYANDVLYTYNKEIDGGTNVQVYFEVEKGAYDTWSTATWSSYYSNGVYCNYYDNNNTPNHSEQHWFKKVKLLFSKADQIRLYSVKYRLVLKIDGTRVLYYPSESGTFVMLPE